MLKKEIKTYQTICDCCGKECKEKKFILPVWETGYEYAYCGTVKVAAFPKKASIIQKEYDLCEEDQKKIAYFMTVINKVKLNEDGVTLTY